jgi:type IV secretion system protein VirB10
MVSLLTGSIAWAQQAGPMPQPALVRQPEVDPVPVAPGTKITIPAGTKVPLILRQTISTGNARPGDPIYASTNFPVIVDDKTVLPAGCYVQGVIDEVKRAGRVKGRAEILVHFRTLILPSGYAVPLGGAVENAPDSDDSKVKDSEGKIQEKGQKGHDAATIAKGAGIGASVGSIATRTGKGAIAGGGAGAVAGLVATLLTRGADVKLPAGSTLDMVLERSLTVDEAKLRAQH